MKKSACLCVILLLVGAAVAHAQDSQESTEPDSKKAQTDRVLELLKLPAEAQKAREAGIPEKEVREVMEEARNRKLSPDETGTILKEGSEATKENGNIEHFGSFVKQQLDEGVRGKDMATAIQDEHRKRGKGKDKGNGGKDQAQHKKKGNGDEGKMKKEQKQEKKQEQDRYQNQEQTKESKGSGKGHDGKGQGSKKGGKSNGKNK